MSLFLHPNNTDNQSNPPCPPPPTPLDSRIRSYETQHCKFFGCTFPEFVWRSLTQHHFGLCLHSGPTGKSDLNLAILCVSSSVTYCMPFTSDWIIYMLESCDCFTVLEIQICHEFSVYAILHHVKRWGIQSALHAHHESFTSWPENYNRTCL